jgi:hypothetical protein
MKFSEKRDIDISRSMYTLGTSKTNRKFEAFLTPGSDPGSGMGKKIRIRIRDE